MKTKIFYSTVVFIVAGLCGSAAFAFDPMGPPTPGVRGLGRASVGMEYSWSDMDIEADGMPELDLSSDTIENVELKKISVNLGLGTSDDSEVFLRIGIADADPDKSDNSDNFAGHAGKSDECFLLGGGAKFTLYKQEKITWGLLTQMSWADFDFDEKSYSIAGHSVTLSTDMEIFEVQIAVGPTVEVHESVAVYGGPFLHFVTGDADLKGTVDGAGERVNADLEQESILGGYVGVELDVTKNADFNIELQGTEAGYAIGASLSYKF